MTTSPIEMLFEPAAIQERVRALGRRISGDPNLPDPLVVALLGGSVVFLADLIRTIETPLRYEFVDVRYSGEQQEMLEIHYPLPVHLQDQRVILVKDVVSSGVLETYLVNELRQHGAAEVRLAALLDVPSERKTNLVVDYGLFTLERNGIFVGYGLKHQGRYGNLPYVGRLPETGGGG